MTLKNTNDNALIELVNRQSSGEITDKIEFATEGSIYERGGKVYLTYKEHKDMGMGNSRVIIKADGNEITMRRMGEFQTIMIYRKDEVTDFNYMTPFGVMNMKIKTEYAENSLSENGGYLKLVYLLFAGGEVAKNEVEIKVKKR